MNSTGDYVATPQDIGVLGLESFLIAIIVFVLIAGLSAFLYRQNKDRWSSFWKFMQHHLTHMFVIVWLLGFLVYLVGTSISAWDLPPFEMFGHLLLQAPMAFVHSVAMFLLESDVSAIHQEFHNSLLFMSCFSFAHFSAAFVSMMFIIKYFGYNLVAKSRLMHARYIKGHVDELYVFWGMNEATYCLAKDIKKVYAEGRRKGSYQIIIINTAGGDSEEVKKEHTGLERLLSFISFNSEEINRYQELGCLTANVFIKLSAVRTIGDSASCDILAKQVDAVSLTKLINKTDKKVHFFILDDDEGDNVAAAGIVCKDSSIVRCSEMGCKVIIYCHARYNSVNRVAEDKYSNDNIEVKVIDSSRESINLLRKYKEYHPVNFVDIDTTDNYGTVISNFNCMVIGFGETGRDAVRYLYEYGAFVSSSSTKGDDAPEISDGDAPKRCCVERSPFNCYIVDKNVTNLKGAFYANAPSVKPLDFCNTDINSSEFYDHLKSVCESMNYVVIALGNDELNITTAVQLFNYVRKNRKNMEKFKIFVRCHNHDQKFYLQRIADHYNQNEKESFIVIFGTEDQIYTYSNVIENNFEDAGKQYNALYCEASGENGKKNRWESRHKILLKEKTLDAYSELRRKESQDIANAYHASTKLFILRKVSEDEDGNARKDFQNIHDCLKGLKSAPVFSRTKVNQDESTCISPQGEFTDKERLLFLNLARLEHLRWNAAHQVLGYRNYSDGDQNCLLVDDNEDHRHNCNETYKLHNCLIDWQDLDAEMNNVKNKWHPDYKLYDYIVLTVTLMMNSKRLLK